MLLVLRPGGIHGRLDSFFTLTLWNLPNPTWTIDLVCVIAAWEPHLMLLHLGFLLQRMSYACVCVCACVTCISGEQARKGGQPILKTGLPLGLPSTYTLSILPCLCLILKGSPYLFFTKSTLPAWLASSRLFAILPTKNEPSYQRHPYRSLLVLHQ